MEKAWSSNYCLIGTSFPSMELLVRYLNLFFLLYLWPLTHPIFFRPIDQLGQTLFPRFPDQRRSEVCAVLSTLILLMVIISPIFLLLWEASDARRGVLDMVWSIALVKVMEEHFFWKVSLKECVKSSLSILNSPLMKRLRCNSCPILWEIPVSSPGLLWNFFLRVLVALWLNLPSR